jgi:lysyl-tRNA synthetase class I
MWKPGETPYVEFLKKLTPEQKAAHLKERRERKAMRNAMKEVQQEFQNVWLSELHNAAFELLKKARETKDPAAFCAVWDRVVGKPKEIELEVSSDKPLPFTDEDLK